MERENNEQELEWLDAMEIGLVLAELETTELDEDI